MSAVIQLSDAGKRYWQMQEQKMLLRSVLPTKRSPKVERWALRHIDFKVEPGETVGILGHNGAGKTTLLRMLAGVSRPSEGRVRITGRIAPLLSVGVGFHQEMSGRENVLVNGMLLGLSKREVERRFDEIVAFAELEQFIDTPVKFYSSGMFMRLGFSVAVHVDPNVMLVDEILAVGDIAFQLKCFQRMRELQAQGTTILFVSHSMHAIRLLCPRALLIRKGRLELDAGSEAVIARHHELMSAEGHELSSVDGDPAAPQPPDTSAITILERVLETADGPTHHPEPGQPVDYRLRLRFNRAVDDPQFTFSVISEEGVLCYSMRTPTGRTWRRFEAGEEAELVTSFTANLGGGTYRLGWTTTTSDYRTVIADDQVGLLIYIAPRLGSAGFSDLNGSIASDGRKLTDHESLLLTGTDRAELATD